MVRGLCDGAAGVQHARTPRSRVWRGVRLAVGRAPGEGDRGERERSLCEVGDECGRGTGASAASAASGAGGGRGGGWVAVWGAAGGVSAKAGESSGGETSVRGVTMVVEGEGVAGTTWRLEAQPGGRAPCRRRGGTQPGCSISRAGFA